MAYSKKKDLSPTEREAILKEARSRMKRGLEVDHDDRERASQELRFVWNKDNCQWDDEAKKARKDRPMLTENRNPAFVKQATNEVRRSRPQIRVLPVDDQADPFTAWVLEGLIRNIEANSRADMSYDEATNLAGYCGRGYWKVTTAYRGDGFDQEIEIQPVPDPFSIVDDPDCAYPDKSDRKWAFEVEKVPREEYEAKYGKAPSFQEAASALGEYAQNWCSDREIIVANYWRVIEEEEPVYLMSDGQVTKDPKAHIQQATLANPLLAAPVVEDERKVVKRKVEWYCVDGLNVHDKGDWAGSYIPLVYTTCEQLKVDGAWHTKGMTFDAKDLTKANNYLLSAQVENIALTPKRPIVGPKGAFDSDRTKWNSINREAHAFVEFDIVEDANGQPIVAPPSRLPGGDVNPEIANVRMGVVDGQRAVIGLMGASLGDRGPEVSGVGINARKTEGDTAIFHVMDNTVRAVRYTGMVVLDLIPKVYRRAKTVRILSPDSEPIMQAINRLYIDPETGQERLIDFSRGKFDISVSAGPAFETHRQSENALLVDLTGKIPQMAQAAPDLIAKRLMTSGDGQEIAQRLARMVPAEIRGEGPPPEVQQLQQQMQQMDAQIKQLGVAKDFAESELAKQRSLVEKAAIDKQRAEVDLQKRVAELEAALAKAHVEREKAELALQRAQLEALRAAMPPALPAMPAGFPAQ